MGIYEIAMSLDSETINTINQPIVDTSETFKKYVRSESALDEQVRKRIYHTHDSQKIREFTTIYIDWLVESGKLVEDKKDEFYQNIINGYELEYSEGKYPDNNYGQMKRISDKVKKELSQLAKNKLTSTQSSIIEKPDGMYVVKDKGSKRITSFAIRPVYIVTYEIETLEEHITTEGFGLFQIEAMNHLTHELTSSTITLRSCDFSSISAFREVLGKSKAHGTFVLGTEQEIIHLGEYLFFNVIADQRTGINIIGIKRTKTGDKVIVTPKGVYDTKGNKVPDMVYVRDEVISVNEVMKLNGMLYEKNLWKEKILPLFIENVLSLHKRSTMLTILGWMMSIPFETYVRVDAHVGGFPHLMISGVNGGGKTGVISTLLPYLGYGTQPEIANFGTQFANNQAVGTSYHIPVAFDEFRPHEWQQSLKNSVERFLRESYNRGYYAKGNKDLSTRRFDYRNPMIILGQMATSDQAIAERVIPVYVDVNYLKSKESKIAKDTYHLLNSAEDKMFWAGYLIWCTNQNKEQILEIYETSKVNIAKKYPQLKEREIVNYAVVSLGLYYFKKLAEEHGLDCHYSDDEIYNVVDTIAEHAEVTLGNKTDDLWRFLEDLAWYGSTYGNDKGKVFGIGKTIMVYQPSDEKQDVYGKDGEKKAEVRGRKVLLIKISDAIKTLNSNGVKNKYDDKMLNPIIKSNFQSAQMNSGQELVLAPQGYRVSGGRYTAFYWEEVKDMFGFVEDLQSDANIKQAAEELIRELKQEEDPPVELEEI